jgi:hypothetical protein
VFAELYILGCRMWFRDVIEDGVPCLEELRGNGHLIVAEVASMVLRLVGRWMSLVIRIVCRGVIQ